MNWSKDGTASLAANCTISGQSGGLVQAAKQAMACRAAFSRGRNHRQRCALQRNGRMETAMLFYALALVAIALVAGVFGLIGMGGVAAPVAQILAGLFVAVFILSVIAGVLRR